MFIEPIKTRNKGKIVFVCSYLSSKYSVLFSVVEFLKVKSDAVFLKIHKECKTNVLWFSIDVVFPSDFLSHT